MTPSYWQTRYESGETHWDKGLPAPPLLEFLKSHPIQGRVLVPGCGSGHDVRALASQGASVLGFDVAPGAIERALSYESVSDETYQLGDFFELPEPLHGTFDAIFEHTCFCAIHPSRRREYAKACLSALKPNGKFLAIFYLTPGDPGDEGPPFGCTIDEINGLFGPHFQWIREEIPRSAFPGREGRELLRLAIRQEEPIQPTNF